MSEGSQNPRAVVLLSGGLDSATVLAIARSEGYRCYCLSFDYGQRHQTELQYAKGVATDLGAEEHRILHLDIGQFGGSALTDLSIDVPIDVPINVPVDASEGAVGDIPVTYVPARNTVFLSHALAWAEVLDASRIFIGVNAVDYSGYPDCRPEFIAAFEQMANLATRAGVTDQRMTIATPLIDLTKADIIKRGLSLGVDYSRTVSCYQLDDSGRACGVCDSCRIRRTGFEQAGVADPTHYR
ncbi:MAG: 7-cyano-7-deazaguanine synthase QueC [Pseudomonadota bacterium]